MFRRQTDLAEVDLRQYLPSQDYKTKQPLTTPKEQEAALFLKLLDSGVCKRPGRS
jgi:hypothetical protein